MNLIRKYVATVVFFFILGGFIVAAFTYDPNAGAKKLRDTLIAGCERSKARSLVFEEFAQAAAAARRSSAASEGAQGNHIEAANDLNAAKQYEGFADAYAKLTPQDCDSAYPAL